jgi:hypothetical protein
MSDASTRPAPGSIEALSSQLEAVAVATLMQAMTGKDQKIAVEAAKATLMALGKDRKPAEPVNTGNTFNIALLPNMREAMKGLGSVAKLIGGGEELADAERSAVRVLAESPAESGEG